MTLNDPEPRFQGQLIGQATKSSNVNQTSIKQ